MSNQSSGVKAIWIALGVVFAIQLFFVFLHFSSQQGTIAYIDNNRLLNSYKGMEDARKAFESKAKGWQANIDTLTSEVKKAIMDYEKESRKMSKKEKELSRELIKTKQQQLQNYQQAIQQQSAQEDNRMTQEVLTKVNAFLTEYGKQKNYEIILGATTAGNIIYAREALDITDEALEALNQNYLGN